MDPSSSPETFPPPIGLRDTLIDTADRQDWDQLTALCKQHREEIRRSFTDWRTVPVSIRDDPIERDRYCHGVAAIAQTFEQAGDRSLIEVLIGKEEDNPIVVWERDLAEAQKLMDDERPEEAVELLRTVLARTKRLRGSGVNFYLPRTFGLLGAAYFHAGETKRAAEFTRKALVLCEELGDEEGVAVYRGNLEQIRAEE